MVIPPVAVTAVAPNVPETVTFSLIATDVVFVPPIVNVPAVTVSILFVMIAFEAVIEDIYIDTIFYDPMATQNTLPVAFETALNPVGVTSNTPVFWSVPTTFVVKKTRGVLLNGSEKVRVVPAGVVVVILPDSILLFVSFTTIGFLYVVPEIFVNVWVVPNILIPIAEGDISTIDALANPNVAITDVSLLSQEAGLKPFVNVFIPVKI